MPRCRQEQGSQQQSVVQLPQHLIFVLLMSTPFFCCIYLLLQPITFIIHLIEVPDMLEYREHCMQYRKSQEVVQKFARITQDSCKINRGIMLDSQRNHVRFLKGLSRVLQDSYKILESSFKNHVRFLKVLSIIQEMFKNLVRFLKDS